MPQNFLIFSPEMSTRIVLSSVFVQAGFSNPSKIERSKLPTINLFLEVKIGESCSYYPMARNRKEQLLQYIKEMEFPIFNIVKKNDEADIVVFFKRGYRKIDGRRTRILINSWYSTENVQRLKDKVVRTEGKFNPVHIEQGLKSFKSEKNLSIFDCTGMFDMCVNLLTLKSVPM